MRHSLGPAEVVDLLHHYGPKNFSTQPSSAADRKGIAFVTGFLSNLQPLPGQSSLPLIKRAADYCQAEGYPEWVYACILTGIEWAYYEGDGFCAFCGKPHLETSLAPALRGYLFATKQPVCAKCAEMMRGLAGK
jgi:hypothetical protein